MIASASLEPGMYGDRFVDSEQLTQERSPKAFTAANVDDEFPMSASFSLRPDFPKPEIHALSARCAFRAVLDDLAECGEHSRHAGFYTQDDFVRLCKLTGSSRHCTANGAEQIKEATGAAIHPETSEVKRMSALMRLAGVSWSTASVMLHLTLGQDYPVLGGQELWSLGYDRKPGINFDSWWAYVISCRAIRSELMVPMRVLCCGLRQFAQEKRSPQRGQFAGNPDSIHQDELKRAS